jgi:hypothetical protein
LHKTVTSANTGNVIHRVINLFSFINEFCQPYDRVALELRSRHIVAKHSLIGRHCPIAACHISCAQLNGYYQARKQAAVSYHRRGE